MASAYEISHLQVLYQIRRNLHDFVQMRSTEVDVVIKNGAVLLRILQEAGNLRTDHRIQSEERTEEHDVARIDFRCGKLQLVVRMIFIEDVVGIVVLVEESQRERRLRFREDAHIVSIHPIISQKLNHILSYAVVARLADKRSIYARTAQRDDCIE